MVTNVQHQRDADGERGRDVLADPVGLRPIEASANSE